MALLIILVSKDKYHKFITKPRSPDTKNSNSQDLYVELDTKPLDTEPARADMIGLKGKDPN